MLEELSGKLQPLFKSLRSHGKLSEKDISEAMRGIRMVLLEADVNFRVVKDFIKNVSEKAMGQEVLKSVTPGHQVVKIVHDELVRIMGSRPYESSFFQGALHKIMVVGLQGSGKTTAASKLALFCRKNFKKSPLLVAADVYRPAAVKQLEILGKSLSVPVYTEPESKDPVEICKGSVDYARENELNVLIIDTAGRLHIDDEMMEEVTRIRKILDPHEILFVADAMTGQDAVTVAKTFNDRLDFSGVILTKMDGDSRGGAALSILGVTGKPICYIGTGEKPDALEIFHADRLVSRMLGMGDIVSLVEKAQQEVDVDQAKKLEQKLKKNKFNFEDFLGQLKMIKRMGPLDQLLKLIPGVNKIAQGQEVDDGALVRIEAIISSMTRKERQFPKIIDGSRRKRISRGSGTDVSEVNKLIKQFEMMQKMFKKMNKFSRMRGSGMDKIMRSMGVSF
jgi:signal recognition particle subunit SRP54